MLYAFLWVVGVWILYADVSEHSVPSSKAGRYEKLLGLRILKLSHGMKMEQSVPKRRHIKFRRRGITQKKAYKMLIYLQFN